MRTIPIALAALALFAAGAAAQTMPRTTPAAPTATQPMPREPAINPLTQDDLSKVEGSAVYGGDNSRIGHIAAVLMDPQSKKIDRLVVAAGGVLGIASRRVALPLDQFAWDAQKGGFRIAQTTASLKSMPEWIEGATATGSSHPPTKEPPAGAGNDSGK